MLRHTFGSGYLPGYQPPRSRNLCWFLRNWQSWLCRASSPHSRGGAPRQYDMAKLRCILLFVSDFVVSGIRQWRGSAGRIFVSSCKLRDDEGTMVVNKHLNMALAKPSTSTERIQERETRYDMLLLANAVCRKS